MKSQRYADAIGLVVALGLFAGASTQSPKSTNPLDQLLRTVFTARNSKVAQVKVLDLRAIDMGAGGYVLLGWGIRPDIKFEGTLEDELFGVFVLNNEMTQIQRTLDIFPTCRWADCIVSIERLSLPASEVVVVGAGSHGDQAFRKTYQLGPSR